MFKKSILSVLSVVAVIGCTPAERTMSSYGHIERESSIAGSIFSSDLETASNDDVARVLDGVIPLKEHGGLAILSIGSLYFVDAGFSDSVSATLSQELKDNPYIGNIVKVPRLLMENKVTVSSIREMGARLLCENVLVYTANNDSRYDHNVFTKDELRVNLTVEAVLVNVRTGCIPVAVSSDQTTVIKQQSSDFDRYEFTRRAYRECLISGIKETSDKINTVLKKVK